MSASSELPAKCQGCAKLAVPAIIHSRCDFCLELEFHEAVLCHLNRCIQDLSGFRCHAFQPILKIASPSGNRVRDLPDGPKDLRQRRSFLKLLRSEKIKYERALALQKLERDPDGVFMELKYHFVWNVIHRRAVFSSANDIFDYVHDTFSGCNELVGGFVSLLWLGPDHVHLYVESDGENSVERMVQEIKRFSKSAIVAEFVDIKEKLAGGNEIWDIAYFAETVG
jgi:REP element-mobilizing transposase RayT